MKGLLITPEEKKIEEIDINNHAEITRLIGFDTIISDEINEQGDRLFFDEECFIRGIDGRFQLDSLIPVAGIGIVVGAISNTELKDRTISKDELVSRVKFL